IFPPRRAQMLTATLEAGSSNPQDVKYIARRAYTVTRDNTTSKNIMNRYRNCEEKAVPSTPCISPSEPAYFFRGYPSNDISLIPGLIPGGFFLGGFFLGRIFFWGFCRSRLGDAQRVRTGKRLFQAAIEFLVQFFL